MAPRRWAPLLLFALGALLACLGPFAQGSYSSGSAQAPAPGEERALASMGSFELEKVRVLGVPVIMVAAPTLGSGKYQPTAEQRGRVIEGNLELLYKQLLLCSHGEALAERFVQIVLHNKEQTCNGQGLGFLGTPDDLKLEVLVGSDGSQQILAVLPAREQPLALLTVTSEDARLNGTTTEKLAESWRKLLQKRLRFARYLMQPEQLLSRWRFLLSIEFWLALLFIGCVLLWRRCRPVMQKSLGPAHNKAWLNGAKAQLFSRLLIFTGLLLLVAMAAGFVFAVPGQVPLALELLYQPAAVLIKFLLLGFVALLSRLLAGALLGQWAANVNVPMEARARRQQRYRSLVRVFRRLIDLGALVLAGGWALADIPGISALSASAILASGALIGALALVFQGLLRDFVSGLVVLLDDRYAIGDTVDISGFSGEVIDIGVLSTELRCLDQRSVFIQNSMCEQVVNHTKLRSGMLVNLLISHQAGNINGVLATISQVLESFAKDPQWQDLLLATPLLRGVSATDALGITVSTLLLTKAGEQWRCERELRRRLLERLQREGIPMANRTTAYV
jgi:small conductance mechanosensitive channel